MSKPKVECPAGLQQKRPHLYEIYVNTVHRLNKDARAFNDEEKDEQGKSSLFWTYLEEINETINYLRQLENEYVKIRQEIINAGPPKRPDPEDDGGGTPVQAKLSGGFLSAVA